MPFSDNVGLFDPAVHGLTDKSTLLADKDISLATLVSHMNDPYSNIGDFFEGDLITLAVDGNLSTTGITLVLPDIGALLSDFGYLGFLNDPKAVLNGLDIILDQMQSLFDNYLSDIMLLVVGDPRQWHSGHSRYCARNRRQGHLHHKRCRHGRWSGAVKAVV